MDKQEFSSKVLDCERTLYRVSRAILHNESDCEDAVQNAILSAYRKLSSLNKSEYFTTWLVRILINECNMLLRTRGRYVPLDDFVSEQAEAPDDIESRELYNAVAILEAPLRLAVVLYYIEGYSVKETAAMMKIPSGTVKSRLAKARKLLRCSLDFEDDAFCSQKCNSEKSCTTNA